MKRNLILLSMGLIFLNACYYDNEEDLYPDGEGPCITDNVSYSGTVAPILDLRDCTSTGCHSGSSPAGNISLDNYSGVKVVVDNGKLMGAIKQEPGFSPMPRARPQIPNCDIQQIQVWVDAGAPNN